MSAVKQSTKFALRVVGSLHHAVRGKLIGTSVGRRPSASCQIPGLQSIVDAQLGDRTHGRFVEVGAYDGERFSNTSWLADNGWRGLYIEPSRQYARLCRLRHCLNAVTVANLAAGAADATATLTQIGSLSTISHETLEEYDRIPWARKQIAKECRRQPTQIMSLDRILTEHQVPPGFELLVVDVEGFEESVFVGFDLARWQPTLVIVELCDVHPDFADNPALVVSKIGCARKSWQRDTASSTAIRSIRCSASRARSVAPQPARLPSGLSKKV